MSKFIKAFQCTSTVKVLYSVTSPKAAVKDEKTGVQPKTLHNQQKKIQNPDTLRR